MDNTNNLILIGGGGHCVSVLDAVLRENRFRKIVITDEAAVSGSAVLGCPVVGTDECLSRLSADGYRQAFITLGSQEDTSLRRRLAENAAAIGFSFPQIVDPSAVVSSFAGLGEGVFAGKTAVVNAEARIGDHAIINTGAVIEHECVVGHLPIFPSVPYCAGRHRSARTVSWDRVR